jgi:hypothetical protein
MPATVAKLRKHIHVVGMIKKTPKILYSFKGKRRTVDGIYRLLKKRPGRVKLLASALVTPGVTRLAKTTSVTLGKP